MSSTANLVVAPIAPRQMHDGRHLMEMGYTSIDGVDGDIAVVATSYTYSYSSSQVSQAQQQGK